MRVDRKQKKLSKYVPFDPYTPCNPNSASRDQLKGLKVVFGEEEDGLHICFFDYAKSTAEFLLELETKNLVVSI